MAAVLGVGVGLVAATVLTRVARPTPPAAHAEEDRQELPVRVPPGWDARYTSRLAAVEWRLGSLERAKAPSEPTQAPTPPPAAPGPERDRADEIAESYRNDLAHQSESLSRHEQEPRDGAWAGKQTDVLTQSFKEATLADHPMRLGRVDCRSATCVVELVYPTPADAAEDRGILRRALAPGCHGMSSALTTPTGPGEYTATAIYYCR